MKKPSSLTVLIGSVLLLALTLRAAEYEKIAFDFGQDPKTEVYRTFKCNATAAVDRIAFALKCPFRHRILLRVRDASGQVFQRKLCPVTGIWWRYDESLTEDWEFVYGGADDKVMHQPIRSFDIYVHNPKLRQMRREEVLVKDVEFVQAANPRLPKLTVDAVYGATSEDSVMMVEVRPGTEAFAGGKLAVRWTDWEGKVIRTQGVDCPEIAVGGVWSNRFPFVRLPADCNAVFAKVALKGERCRLRADGPSWARRPQPVRNAGKADAQSKLGTGIYCQRWGVNAWAHAKQHRPLIESARDAGIKWLREQIVWDHVIRSGAPDFTGYDAIVSACEENGLSVCMLFGGPGREVKWTDSDYCEKYCEALRQAVRHYRGRVAVWELCNEPNLPWPMDPRWVANYRRLLTMATQVIRDEDPSARTAGCSASGLGIGFLKDMRGEGHDDVSIHPYRRFMDEPEFLADMEEVRTAAGGRNVWLTEIGWTGWYRPYGDERLSQEERPVSFREQAVQLARAYLTAMASSAVKAVFGYDFVDDGFLACGHERHMGVLHGEWKHGFLPKPAYLALATIGSHFQSGAATMECRDDGLVIFRMDGNEAIWSRTQDPVRYRVPKGGELSNLMGERIEAVAESNGDRWVEVSCQRMVFVRRK